MVTLWAASGTGWTRKWPRGLSSSRPAHGKTAPGFVRLEQRHSKLRHPQPQACKTANHRPVFLYHSKSTDLSYQSVYMTNRTHHICVAWIAHLSSTGILIARIILSCEPKRGMMRTRAPIPHRPTPTHTNIVLQMHVADSLRDAIYGLSLDRGSIINSAFGTSGRARALGLGELVARHPARWLHTLSAWLA